MIKHVFVLFLFILALQIEASVENDFKARTEWVSELKSFVQDLETKNPNLLTSSTGQNLLQRFSLFEEAIASGNYECFFAGWPSTLVKSGGKKLCQNPAKGNAEYQNGSCKSGQLQCQPMMFGKDLCVGFSSQKDKQLAFSKCEVSFKKKGSYDFLKSMTSEEKMALKEISLLAHDICVSGDVGIQKSKPMCKSLMNKFKDGMSAIDRAPANLEIEVDNEVVKEEEKEVVKEDEVKEIKNEKDIKINEEDDLIPIVLNPTTNDAVICPEEIVVDKKIEAQANANIKVVNHNTDSVYEEIKKEFLLSPLCEPDKVLNDPKEKLSPILFTQLIEDMAFVVKTDAYLTRAVKVARFKELCQEYGLSNETIAYGEGLLNNYEETSSSRFDAMARLRGVMLQDMEKASKRTPSYQADLTKEKLLERKIFTEDADGYPQCPFVSEDAFREALAGREAIMKSGNKSKITDPNIITIVDYSRPSNERRMFVIDIKTKKVLHNTWVGHGAGKDRSQEGGTDTKGSSPLTSDAAGSYLSSEGFYIAKAASSGGTYLNNVTLEGIDKNNKSMGSRAIVIHGWRTPNHEYLAKTWVMSEAKNPKDSKRLPGKDIYKNFMETDFKTTTVDLFNLTQDMRGNAAGADRIEGTDGCLGVPDTQMKQADRKGRDKSQLELLREDLPGTLMYNYTGPGKTKSQYLN